MADPDTSPPAGLEAWRAFVAGLGEAGEAMAAEVARLSPAEQADGFRALVRATHSQLARFEVDRDLPELVPFNGWRQKFFMDNPDSRYWVADISDRGSYRITGNRGDAVFVSITVYAGRGVASASASARIDSDTMTFGPTGEFSVTVSPTRPASGDWVELPEGANAVWVRQFVDAPPAHEPNTQPGDQAAPPRCEIEPLAPVPTPPFIDPDRFAHRLARLGPAMTGVAGVLANAASSEQPRGNHARRWSEMADGAAFTEPGIEYVRGAWQLEPGEALVVDGEVAPCRYWNVLLYSRFLNSLDHRHRTVSRTTSAIATADGRYRLVLAAEDPGVPNWLDTEGRPFGMFVLRWLHAPEPPPVPAVRVVPVAELREEGR